MFLYLCGIFMHSMEIRKVLLHLHIDFLSNKHHWCKFMSKRERKKEEQSIEFRLAIQRSLPYIQFCLWDSISVSTSPVIYDCWYFPCLTVDFRARWSEFPGQAMPSQTPAFSEKSSKAAGMPGGRPHSPVVLEHKIWNGKSFSTGVERDREKMKLQAGKD